MSDPRQPHPPHPQGPGQYGSGPQQPQAAPPGPQFAQPQQPQQPQQPHPQAGEQQMQLKLPSTLSIPTRGGKLVCFIGYCLTALGLLLFIIGGLGMLFTNSYSDLEDLPGLVTAFFVGLQFMIIGGITVCAGFLQQMLTVLKAR